MKKATKPPYEELEARLAETEAVLTAIRKEEVDAVLSADSVLLLRTHHAEEALRQANEALQQSEKRFRAVFERAAAGLLIADPGHGYLHVNDRFCEITGYSCEELRDMGWVQILHPEDQQAVMAEVRRLLRGEILSFTRDCRYVRVDGRIIWVRVNVSLLCEGGQEGQARLIGVVEDIDTVKRVAEELARVREIAERRMADLEAANKEIETFAYSVSHDLRAPLRAIDGFSRALLEDYSADLDESGKQYVQRICAAAKRMDDLINAMLTLSRLTNREVVPTRINLSAIAAQISDDLKKTAPERQVEWVIAENVIALADAAMIRAVLDNLLRNGWKFTAKRRGARIEFGVREEVGETVYFVRDNGAGFDMEYAHKLFIAFQRLHDAGDFPGIGIGLATAQRIIQRHGGRIWAEGAVEKGATFFFTLGKGKK